MTEHPLMAGNRTAWCLALEGARTFPGFWGAPCFCAEESLESGSVTESGASPVSGGLQSGPSSAVISGCLCRREQKLHLQTKPF